LGRYFGADEAQVGFFPNVKQPAFAERPFPRRIDPPAIPVFVRIAPKHCANEWRNIYERLPVVRDDSIQIDQMSDASWDAIRNPGDHHTRIAVSDEDHMLQIFRLNDVDDILNVSIESNFRGQERRLFP
jgi:hypothetical protein